MFLAWSHLQSKKENSEHTLYILEFQAACLELCVSTQIKLRIWVAIKLLVQIKPHLSHLTASDLYCPSFLGPLFCLTTK